MSVAAPAGSRVIVVGAGIGGLATAVDLAASGCEVTLLERHATPGGKMRELAVGDGDTSIDSGPTVLTMRWVFDALFRAAGLDLDEALTLHRAEVLARHAWPDGSRLDLHADVEESVRAIAELSGPEEGRGYRRFARDAADLFRLLDLDFMQAERPGVFGLSRSLGLSGLLRLSTRPFVSLWRALGGYFRDPRLRQLFGRYATYCGSSPFAAPATLMLIAHAERAGVWTVAGGMQRLADALAALASRSGVRMHYDTEVRELIAADGRIAGVVLADGAPIPADAVVFAGDTEALARGLLGPAARRAVPARRAGPRSLSAITWSLQARPAGFPLLHHTVFFGRDYAAEFAALFDQAAICESPTVYVCAQDQSEHAPVSPAAVQRLFLLVNAPPRTFDDAELAAVTARVGRVLSDQGLDLKLDDTGVQTTTPADFDALCPASDGALYGWPTHGWNAAFRRPGARARIPGLYLAGGTVHPGPGVPMTALSGRLAAVAVRRDLGLG